MVLRHAGFVLLVALFGLTLTSGALAVTKRGDAKPNRITGTSQADRLSGGGGKDVLRGLGGPDRLDGGKAADRVLGGSGRDRLIGGKGHDRRGRAGRPCRHRPTGGRPATCR